MSAECKGQALWMPFTPPVRKCAEMWFLGAGHAREGWQVDGRWTGVQALCGTGWVAQSGLVLLGAFGVC